MTKLKKIIFLVTLSTISIFLSSCGKNFDNVNANSDEHYGNNIYSVATQCGIVNKIKDPIYKKYIIYNKNDFASLDDFNKHVKCLANAISPNNDQMYRELSDINRKYNNNEDNFYTYLKGDFIVIMHYISKDTNCNKSSGLAQNLSQMGDIKRFDTSSDCRTIVVFDRKDMNRMLQDISH